MIGIDNSGDKYSDGDFFNRKVMDTLGVDFVVYHLRTPNGTVEDEVRRASLLGRTFEEAGLKVIVNVECANTAKEITTRDGFDWVNQSGNSHLFRFPASVLQTLSQSDAVWGIQYDELEHSQLTRNLSITLRNPGVEMAALSETTGMDFKMADSAVCDSAKALVGELSSNGIQNVYSEHVWPVLFHNFARAGITPVYKQMKENWSNVWASCALGACLQYDKELWACLDFWNYNHFPGHSAETLWSNLLFAYWLGVDKAYVEAIGNHTYELSNGDYNSIRLKERGEVLRRFTKEYVPSNPRPYTFRDFVPEIAIIRFDDTEWGQGPDTYCTAVDGDSTTYFHWKDWLFGAYNLNTSEESEEWIKAWHTITHGAVNPNSLSWNAINDYKDEPYRCFAPANTPVVYDDQVHGKLLKGLKLVFLCGLSIEQHTLKSIGELVENDGLVVVTSKRFAPSKYKDEYSSGVKTFQDGKGKWIITDNMGSEELKGIVNPWLGKNDEITMRFKGDRKITMKILPGGNSLKIMEKKI